MKTILDILTAQVHNTAIMNTLSKDKKTQVLAALIEGNSIRATVRMTGVAKKTVMRLLVEAGTFCADYQDRMFRNLHCRRLQLDEMWGWTYCKQKNVTPEIVEQHPDAGDIWLWVAMDAETKLVPSWLLGQRDGRTAQTFVADLASRLSNRVQITSDGHRVYLEAIESAFGSDVNYSMLIKMFDNDRESEVRYSPAECTGTRVIPIIGNPDPRYISTSYVERQNWTVRTNMRRYTRLSNGFSRKLENHAAAVSLNYFAYNFVKIHSTLRISPAMAAGVTDRLWSMSDLVDLWESEERKERAA